MPKKNKGLDAELFGDGLLVESVSTQKRVKKSPYPPEMLAAPYYRGHDYAFISTIEEWDEFIKRCKAVERVGWDIETAGRDPFKDDIHGFSLSPEAGVARYVFWSVVAANRERCAKDLSECKLVTQGGKFDFHFMAEHLPEYPIRCDGDTMIQLHLDDPDQPKGLKLQAWNKLNAHMMTLAECLGVNENALKKGKVDIDFDKIPRDRLLHYGCHDADLTLQLYYKLKENIKGYSGPEVVDTYLQVPVIMEMERTGLLVNKEYLEALVPIFERAILRMEKKIYGVVGHSFDIFSPAQVGKVIFDELGMAPLKYTKTGKPSTTADDLERLAMTSDNDVLKWIVEAKHHSHSLSAYVKGVLNGTCDKTGALHAEYGLCRAPTFRLNCSKGQLGGGGINVQQVPKAPEPMEVDLADEEVENLKNAGVDVEPTDEDGVYTVTYKARKAFVARPGKYFVSADYQAIEFRLIMSFSGENAVGRAIRDGMDGHKYIASLLYRKPMEEVSKPERDAVKTLNYGLAYGMAPFGLAQRLNISEELAKELFNRYFQAMPKVKNYLDSVKKFARKSGYVTTYWGRKREIRDYSFNWNRGDRSAANTVIQGSAADAMRIALVKCHMLMRKKFGQKVNLVATLHDQIIFEVDESIKLEDFVPFVRKGMEMDREDWNCPLPVDVSYGPNWGDLRDWEEKVEEKKQKIVIEIGSGADIKTVFEEISVLLEELQEGDFGLYVIKDGRPSYIRSVEYKKGSFDNFEESLGPLGDYVKVRLEDDEGETPKEPSESDSGVSEVSS